MASRYLHEEALVDTYLSHHMPNKKYPYRMQQVKEASPTTVEQSEKHILDSSIGKEHGNEHVIEKAEYLGCSVIVPADVIGNHEETVAQVLDMMERCEGTDRRVVVPIQAESSAASYADNARAMKDVIEDAGYSHLVDRYGIGGVKDADAHKQIEYTQAVSDAIDEPIHVFGAGMSKDWIREIRANHESIESIDMATPVYAAKSNEFIQFNTERMSYEKPRGKHVTFANARLVEAMLTQFNYMISNGPDEDEVREILE